MSRKYKFHNPDGLYFITFTVQGWVDVFTRNAYKDIVVENLAYCQKLKGLELFAWCIMSNHVHMIVRAEGKQSLSEILRDFKKHTSKAIFKAIVDNDFESRREMLLQHFSTPEGIRFWQSENSPIELWSNAVITQKLNYIHQNPVEEGLVFRSEDYVYSSAIDYSGEKGMLDIFVIE
ncbi:MAG: transposase [Prolixibacteraceae bacterium]|nr:transposase [Prolixibacteraceae bacterium]